MTVQCSDSSIVVLSLILIRRRRSGLIRLSSDSLSADGHRVPEDRRRCLRTIGGDGLIEKMAGRSTPLCMLSARVLPVCAVVDPGVRVRCYDPARATRGAQGSRFTADLRPYGRGTVDT